MASRLGYSSLHQRDSRSALFEGYINDDAIQRTVTTSPGRGPRAGSPQGYGLSADSRGGYRPATPNSRGQYSHAVLNELESQNDDQVDSILGKVKILKNMSVEMGNEIRESTALAEKMNDAYERIRTRLRGTMNRMLIMAQRTGVGWKVWLGFLAAVIFLFTYVWLF